MSHLAQAALLAKAAVGTRPIAWLDVSDPRERMHCVLALEAEGFDVEMPAVGAGRALLVEGHFALAIGESERWDEDLWRALETGPVPYVRIADAARGGDVPCDRAWLLPRPLPEGVLRGYARCAVRLLAMVAADGAMRAELEQRRDDAEADAAMARETLRRLHGSRQDRLLPVDAYVAPAAGFSGDLVIAEATPSGNVHVLLADGVGHGLAAAFTVLPMSRIFRTMTRKGFGLPTIVSEMSATLRHYLPTGRFVATTLAAFDPANARLDVWNAGNPEAFAVDADGNIVRRFPSRNLALGIVDYTESDIKLDTVAVDEGALQFIACSDGMLEATGPTGEAFGTQRLVDALVHSAPRGRRYALIESVRAHLAGREATDDLSLAIMECRPGATAPARAAGRPSVIAAFAPAAPRSVNSVRTWRLSLELGAEQLKRIETVPVLQHFLAQLDGDGLDSPKLFLVLAELFNNALDHGLLTLDSRIKAGHDGMTAYIEERRRRLHELSTGTIRISIVRMERSAGVWLKLVVADSGAGFDHERLLNGATAGAEAPHGRGLKLVRAMCDALEYRGCGNEVEAHLSI